MPSDYREISEFYDQEYPELDLLGPDVACFLQHVDGPRVVEIGCGTGRASRAIAAAGREVVGFDIDQAMLDIAHQHGGDVSYVTADATDDGWHEATGGDFDAACCFFNTFLALVDPAGQEACLRGAHAALRPGGRLWLDIFHPNLELILATVGGEDELEPDLFYLPDGRTVLRTTSIYADITQQVQHVTFHYSWYVNEQRVERSRSFDMTWIMPRELERLLRICGFELVESWGDYDGNEIDDDSERQIVLAVRV